MPVTPYAVGSARVTNCHSGWLRPPAAALSGSLGGMNGVRLAALRKKTPATITKTVMLTLISTSTLVTHLDSRMPTVAMTPSTTTMKTAPTLTGASSPNSEVGSPRKSCR